jgi:signal transduction histidine kinase
MISIVSVVAYITLVIFVLSLKTIGERFESQLHENYSELKNRNLELSKLSEEVSNQRAELVSQKEMLEESYDALYSANKMIEEQKAALQQKNYDLEYIVVEKTQHLAQANTELMMHNNELRQYSFMLSHNLKGPIASLKGLMPLIDHEEVSEHNEEVISHLDRTVETLEDVFIDLNTIIDLRHDLYRINQRIDLKDEILEEAKEIFKEVSEDEYELNLELKKLPVIFSNKQKVRDIISNLLTNSLKFRAKERKLKISITSDEDPVHYLFTITDNGRGIDLNQFGNKIFKLYQQFQLEQEGKGMGLYLVKMQAESLGGRVEVESEPDKYTTFKVLVKKPIDFRDQVLLDDSMIRIHFDAEINALVAEWKDQPNEQQYLDSLQLSLEFIKRYQTPVMISDITFRKNVTDAEVGLLNSEFMRRSIVLGLQKIIVVVGAEKGIMKDDMTEKIGGTSKDLDLEVVFVEDLETAKHNAMNL